MNIGGALKCSFGKGAPCGALAALASGPLLPCDPMSLTKPLTRRRPTNMSKLWALRAGVI